MTRNFKIALATSGRFSIPMIKALIEKGWLKVLITKPSKRMGRSMKLQPMPPLKFIRENYPSLSLKVIELDTFKDKKKREETIEALREIDLFVVCDFGLFIPRKVREIPPLAINVHPSLLPKYRGASPIERALLTGERKTGLTIARLTGELDAGPIYFQWEIEILPEDDRMSLHNKLSHLAGEKITEVIERLVTKPFTPYPQRGQETLAPKLQPHEFHLLNYLKVENFLNAVRGLTPDGYLIFRGKKLKVIKARPYSNETPLLSPWTLAVKKENRQRKLLLGLEDGTVELLELQPQSSKKMSAEAFINGYKPSGEKVS